jgi:hypothetical protein
VQEWDFFAEAAGSLRLIDHRFALISMISRNPQPLTTNYRLCPNTQKSHA